MKLTDYLRINMYNAGCYSFPPPPVPHVMWTVWDWIRYIDAEGIWHVQQYKDRMFK